MVTVATKPRCRHCGGTLFLPDGDGGQYCFMCTRPYHNFRDYGRIGGLQTALRYGREHMAEIGRRGGLAGRLPTLSELRQQQAPKTENKVREGMAAQPHNLRVLKELWRERREELLAASSSSLEVS